MSHKKAMQKFGKEWGRGGRGWVPRFKFNFYFLGEGHFKYLYLCGGTPKIIKILVVVPQKLPPPSPTTYHFKA
jgi:hypothetical protein